MLPIATLIYSCASEDKSITEPYTIVKVDGYKYKTDLIATFQGQVGEEVTIGLGVYDDFDIYGVDFGNGEIVGDTVCNENGGLKDEDGHAKPGTAHTRTTEFKGTIAGDGVVKVFGKSDIWCLNISGNLMPTAFDQEKLKNVVQVTISGANVEEVALPALESLKQFAFTNSPVKKVDISKATALTRIDIYNTNVSAFDPQLEEIDLSKNVDLEMVVLGGNTYKKGELTKLNFSNNQKLTQISAENNKLTSVTGIPASVKNIYLSNNELASIKFPEFTAKGTIQIQNNKFTLATLPTKPAVTSASKYTYAPQPAYQVAEAITDANNLLDLSSQLTATGVSTQAETTTFTFFAGATELQKDVDYKEIAAGKFSFLKSQTENVYGVMATEAFPKFSKANAYKTTEFTVTITE